MGGETPIAQTPRCRVTPAAVEPSALAGPLLGRLGRFEIRLAASREDLEAAQRLRFRIFHEGREGAAAGCDADRFDPHCDHLLLIDPDAGSLASDRLVGTCRLLDAAGAARAGAFYSQGEFDVAALMARHAGRQFLELGRSCILPAYRGRRVMELLWHGIWASLLARGADVLFGCASLPGTVPDALAEPLAFLRTHALAPPSWQAAPSGGCVIALPQGSGAAARRLAPASLPPLLKGYLRLGGMVSDHAVVDREFGTTDVLLVLPRERIAPRYIAHYGAAAERFRR